MSKVGDICPNCKSGVLELVNSNFPYNIDYLQCINCDSTYNLNNMSKVIKCIGCLDCKDTIVICNLAYYLKLPLYLVTSYDSWEEGTKDTFSIETPVWCPLKNEGDITIKIK